MNLTILICICFFTLTGCNLFNRSADVEQIIRQDPAFKEIFQKKLDLDAQITTISNELYAYREEIESKISQLKKDYVSRKADADSKLRDLKSRLNPEREELRRRLSAKAGELKIKSQELSSIKARLATLRKMLTSKDAITLKDEARHEWEEELRRLELKEEPVREEIASLRDSLRLLKSELSLLKQ